ncbi:MAG: cadmium-translocating P-type ATPase [Deltaproteobacteria bacterium]|jgi:Cd2+/Zn2+-exporting ATPase|nr:cadmium-translocating P-type ATPase [Deltaproteobacteria bacterium]
MEHPCSICGQLACQEHSHQDHAHNDSQVFNFSQPAGQESLGFDEESPSDDGEDPALPLPGEALEGQAGLTDNAFATPPLYTFELNPPTQTCADPAGHEEAAHDHAAHDHAGHDHGCHDAACHDEACHVEAGHVEAGQVQTAGRVACCDNCDTAPLLTHTVAGAEEETDQEAEAKAKAMLNRLIIASILALCSEVTHFVGLSDWISVPLAAIAVAVGGISTWLAGWKSLRKFKLDILALMSVAVTGAVLIGQFSEAALVLVLFSLAETLEDRSVDRARKAIAKLLQLAPEKATIQKSDGSWVESKASDVPLGTVIRIRPGEKLALDGQVKSGNSAIDQSPITGESVPVEKAPGDKVFAGTLNVTGTLDYEVTVAYGDSALSRIVKVVEAAENSKAPVERFVEKFAKYYTPSVFVLAIISAVLPPLAFGGAWFEWLYRALALLVIACPCALVVSIPVAVLSALARATKAGLLVKGGIYLEEGRHLKVVAMDKTGTLTSGKPTRTDFIPLNGYDAVKADRLAASLASLSKHPISQALARASAEKNNLVEVTDFTDLPGKGVSAKFEGREIALGSQSLIDSLGLMTQGLKKNFEDLERAGKSVVALSDGGLVAALFATADTVKPESKEAVAELRELGVETIMLTGDNALAAQAVANEVGVDGFRNSLMPEDKLALIEDLGKKGKVGMVGDGINDAPALARADIGFSMGAAGTDTAIETADVAIMDDNLAKIPAFIRLSRMVHSIFVQNIVFILLVKLAFIVVTLMGHTYMWMAVFADIGVTLMVMANSLRLTHEKR